MKDDPIHYLHNRRKNELDKEHLLDFKEVLRKKQNKLNDILTRQMREGFTQYGLDPEESIEFKLHKKRMKYAFTIEAIQKCFAVDSLNKEFRDNFEAYVIHK